MISVLIPAYKEADSLPRLIESLKNALFEGHEILIINDENSDGSIETIKKLQAKYDGVRGFFHTVRRGKTEAIKEGVKESKGDIIVLMDADLQYPPEEAVNLIKGLEHADVVNGRRKERRDSLRRRMESRIYNFLIQLFFRLKVYDCNSGLKVFRRKVLLDIAPALRPGWHRYLLVLADKKGYRVVEKPIRHCKRKTGRSKFSSPSRLLKGFYDLLCVKALTLRRR